MIKPFIMSIEITEFEAVQAGFHLGTNEAIARKLCEERYHGRKNAGMPVVTVALLRDDRIVDVYDGQWLNT